MKKILLFLGIFVIMLSGCCPHSQYKVKITHTDNSVDTIIIKVNNVNNLRVISKTHKFIEKCKYCNNNSNKHLLSNNVKQAIIINKVYKNPKSPNKKDYILLFKINISIIIGFFILMFYIKSKSSIMKTIEKYIIYSIIIILLIKLGIVLVKYLPQYIELLLK